eukprot:Plantae.Rhodophyta-Palmaria_palmata.ctg8337.p1 GENE.Plantae.Rhodophyta-Palmaria_palmata.ctg8337~~Plantae.Rhodophyta-Palmaria_palmata.ctg8337.p1  ORF type:complete len:102 (-),score=15.41 Plantae.Rhodophyta-Palmaria_palmata.ctg8337:515-820(-)
MADVEVAHEPLLSRFVARLQGSDGVAFLQYAVTTAASPPYMDLQHTFTPENMRGKGVAGKMVAAAFSHARKMGMKIIPSCSYIPVWVRRHPEEIDLVLSPQ